MKSGLTHQIKHRQYANDEFMTPPELAKKLITLVPLRKGNTVLDPCPGKGAFYNNFPPEVFKSRILGDFLECQTDFDWIIGNPPYSKLDNWFVKTIELSTWGFAYLLGSINITPRRLEIVNEAGFGLTHIHLCKVFHWFGISAFCIWEKDKPNIIGYDRNIWR
uniref:Putative methyltransferase n=1 Tax=viral metagenome TaxID=1070528 RepID=A0A6M3KIY5_9ZZZZ